ncbi:SANT domain-containing protein [Caenorhabditis elegans]|uniref:SANT domain-containing protein n=1 Tax=Caenorhabditis elegans TaxID=6239 RepID=Q9XWN1_CAEEL|nr:SANT domain-containing protein [Caenorhabditis elegans]CAA21620.2 SANT domain-containing protein [Caenorhabditis elegans]|eukprot:NP_001256880.1 Uncharacterized protein CELE_Y43F8C.6 [Caenorhabditis elegans]
MNSRNYENQQQQQGGHVPPVASNTVTIGTSANSQVRIGPSTQIRSLSNVALRHHQPVPIRKIVHHDTGGGPQFQPPKDEPIDNSMLDYQASTSSGPLIATSSQNSNSFQQYQRGGPGGSSAMSSGALVMNSSNNGAANNNMMAMDQPAPVNLAAKVAEVFLTAGHAFQKLGDLTLQLHTTTDADESKWSEKEVDNLKNALTRFAHELDQISTCVANRTTKHIKNDIKRRHMMTSSEDPSSISGGPSAGGSHHPKRMAMSSSGGGAGASGPSSSAPGPSSSYSTGAGGGALLSTGHAVPIMGAGGTGGHKRIMQPIGKMVATRAVIPTRYTVAPSSSTSTVILNSHSSPGGGGMPHLQSQNLSASSAPPPLPRGVVPTTTVTRVVAPHTLLHQGPPIKDLPPASSLIPTSWRKKSPETEFVKN